MGEHVEEVGWEAIQLYDENLVSKRIAIQRLAVRVLNGMPRAVSTNDLSW